MNCERFHDRLLDLLSSRLDPAETKTMLEHCAECAECEAVLSFEESLQLERTEGVEKNVPDRWVTEMWPAVEKEIVGHRVARRAPRPAWRSLRMTVAAALAVALFGAGYLLGQRGAPGMESAVEARITRRDAPPEPFTATSGTFLAALDRLPDERTLVSAEETRSLLRESFRLRRWAATLRPNMDLSDGVQVGEIRALLDAFPPDGATTLPASLDAAEIRRWLSGRV